MNKILILFFTCMIVIIQHVSAHQTVINNTEDWKPSVSFLYHVCEASHAGNIDLKGAGKGNEWTTTGDAGCCVKRIDIRDYETGKFMKMNRDGDAKIDVWNTSIAQKKFTDNPDNSMAVYFGEGKSYYKPPMVLCSGHGTWTLTGSTGLYKLEMPGTDSVVYLSFPKK